MKQFSTSMYSEPMLGILRAGVVLGVVVFLGGCVVIFLCLIVGEFFWRKCSGLLVVLGFFLSKNTSFSLSNKHIVGKVSASHQSKSTRSQLWSWRLQDAREGGMLFYELDCSSYLTLSVNHKKGFQWHWGTCTRQRWLVSAKCITRAEQSHLKHTNQNIGFSLVPQHGTQEDTFRVWWVEINLTVKPYEDWTSIWAVNSLKKGSRWLIYLQTFQRLYVLRAEIQRRGNQSGDYVNRLKSEEKYIHLFKTQVWIWNSVSSSSLSLPCCNSRPSDCPLQGFNAISDHNCS